MKFDVNFIWPEVKGIARLGSLSLTVKCMGSSDNNARLQVSKDYLASYSGQALLIAAGDLQRAAAKVLREIMGVAE